ncbi:nickel pincer cofactor biosynthesis protein LarC [Halococcus hamelinensis]|nr:nickel pincer cofactor biosynthesis protein LarC [Halococcus hamelinensis]
MRTLAFDGRMGASGDMVCAALIAAGAEPSVLEPVEEVLDVRYRIGTTAKNGITATTVDVLLDDGGQDRDEHGDEHSHGDHDHPHDGHEHSHGEHGHSHGDHAHDGHTHAEGAGPSRSYAEVVELVESMGLPAGVGTDAKAVFEVLGRAEAAVHGTDLAETHFHEVGADDAIADVVGAALLLDDLDVERVVTTPVATGGGEVEMSHGTYPIPTPAVVEVAERASWALRGGPVEAELLTPTGAAILAHFAEGVERLPTLDLDGSGYGAGDKDFPEHPNVLRTLVGEGRGSLTPDEIRVLETTLDDATPELLGGLHESLKEAGARDVSVFPTTMKKSRPGHLVQVIVKPEDAERVARELAVETGTLGVRETGARHRWIAERAFETAEIEVDGTTYEITVKVASDSAGEVYDVSAEYDEATAVAAESGVPVREVMRRAENVVRE